MHRDCIILAGGMGTRLQGVVSDRPKCLADINGKPFLYYLAKQLSAYHFCKVIFSIGYKGNMVKEYVMSHRDEFKFAFDFAEESEPLGTGGAILNALPYSDTEDFFVVNGDTFFDVNFDTMLQIQQNKMADCTIALKPMSNTDRYGLVHINKEEQICSFEEKKTDGNGLINGGIYCIYKNSFLNIPFPQKFSFEKEYLEKMITERDMYAYISNSYFIDIGIPTDFERAQTEIPALFNQTHS
mgnify:CR=1 FL=1